LGVLIGVVSSSFYPYFPIRIFLSVFSVSSDGSLFECNEYTILTDFRQDFAEDWPP
jgi:hypothetical protein